MAATATDARATTRERILDAMFEAVQDFGLSRTTVEDVAQRAGLSRQTVYRYFPSKDHLVLELVLREEEKFIEGTRAAFSSETDLEVAVERAMVFTLRSAREHPLLDRLLATDSETFLPFLTTRGLPVIARARDAMVDLIAERHPHLDPELLRGTFDLATRASLSYIITPSERPSELVSRTMARTLVAAIEAAERGAS
jgi:AcrR family transcriptional regulator